MRPWWSIFTSASGFWRGSPGVGDLRDHRLLLPALQPPGGEEGPTPPMLLLPRVSEESGFAILTSPITNQMLTSCNISLNAPGEESGILPIT